MPLPTDEQLARLPRWAQSEIGRLRRDVEHYQRRLREGPEDSRVFAEPYSSAPVPLGADPIIEFHLLDGKVRVEIEGDHLTISSDTGALHVQPSASNGFKTKPGAWW